MRKFTAFAMCAAVAGLLALPQGSSAATLVAGYDFTGAAEASKLEDKVNSFDLTKVISASGDVTYGSSGSFSWASFNNGSGAGANAASLSISLPATPTSNWIVPSHPSVVSFWVRSAAATNAVRFFTVNGVIVEFASTNKVRTRDGGGTNAAIAANNSYDLNAWNLVSVYISAPYTTPGTLSLFLNDEPVATTPADISQYGNGVQSLNVGAGIFGFVGDIGGVRVYSDVANAAAAETLHDSLLAAGGPVAIPEPASLALAGLVGLQILGRGRRQG